MTNRSFAIFLVIALAVGFFTGKMLFGNDENVPAASAAGSNSAALEELEQRIAVLEVEVELMKDKDQGTLPPQEIPEETSGGEVTETEDGGEASLTEPEEDEFEEVSGKVVVIRSQNNYVNVRTGPGETYGVIQKVYKDEPMTVLGEQNDWYRVKLEDGSLAWVANWVVVDKE